MYRVRKSWDNPQSQIGAFNVLENAIALCKENEGYYVYDDTGKVVYPEDKKCPYQPPTRVLKRGCFGNDVRWLQWELEYLGFKCGPSGVDGDFGNATEQAVLEYQKKYNLETDGICGPATQASLKKNGADSKAPDKKSFIPRLTIPEKWNPYYNTISNGGYSTAIQGSPTQYGLNVLANCFTGDTKIITRTGVVCLKDIVDKEVEVLSKDGVYRKATGRCFGEQELYRVTFSNGSSYECTANHRWCVKKSKNSTDYEIIFKETKDLTLNSYVPYNFILDEECNEDGIRHGFIYGSGSYCDEGKSSQVNLCGRKINYMKDYFLDSKHTYEQSNGTIYCYPYPKEYKSIPNITMPLPYLRGFIKGLIASSEYVDKDKHTKIGALKYDDATKISQICTILGYRNKIIPEAKDINHKKDSTLYLIRFKKSSIPASMFINPEQREKASKKRKNVKFTKVKEIVALNKTALVYCVQEPETHTMTLEDGILTGQCVGYAAGRFNEIIGLNKFVYLQYPPNAEDFIARAKTEGLIISQQPSLGSIIVWSKGKAGVSADGAGHVAVVEKINEDGSIITSESGYNCANPFWTTKRYCSGNTWGNNPPYYFLGFIKNPAVK